MMINEIKASFSENKKTIFLSVAILFISLIMGYVLEPHLYSYFNPVVEDLTQKVQTGTLTLTFADIFLNNFRIIFQMFVFGIACCFSAFMLAFNGFFVGYYIGASDDIVRVLLLIVPHGIFEFSSIILACTSGLVLFNSLYIFLKTLWLDKNESLTLSLKNAFNACSKKIKHAVIIFLTASILMVIAGIVEVYFTIPIAEFIIKFL